MSDNETSTGGSETPTPVPTPATGTPPGSATPPTSNTSAIEELQRRFEELERTHKNAKEELDRHRKNAKKLADYEKAELEAKEAQLSEIERIKKQHADLQAQHEAHMRQTQERIVRYEVEAQARKLNIIDPEAAAKLLEWAELEYDEDGTPNNAAKLLEKLIKNKPYLAPARQEEQTQQTPAQTAQPPRAATPAIPAMNPGRTNIPAPGTVPPGKIPRLSDVYKRP